MEWRPHWRQTATGVAIGIAGIAAPLDVTDASTGPSDRVVRRAANSLRSLANEIMIARSAAALGRGDGRGFGWKRRVRVRYRLENVNKSAFVVHVRCTFVECTQQRGGRMLNASSGFELDKPRWHFREAAWHAHGFKRFQARRWVTHRLQDLCGGMTPA